jgi:hypothetical protein
MARENEGWGYKRIEGSLQNLGFSICSTTVANILKQHGIAPVPIRKRLLTWNKFFKAHWDVFSGIDLDAVKLWLGELVNLILGHFAQGTNVSKENFETKHDVIDFSLTPTSRVFQLPTTASPPTRAPPCLAIGLHSTSLDENRRAA